MQWRNDPNRYGALSQGFHWVIAALIVALFLIGWYMEGLPLGPDKIRIYNLHKSIGVLVLALASLRLVWRLLSPPPGLPEAMADWQKRAASASHFLLYLLIFAQPVIGILHSNAANFPVVVFGSLTLPSLIGPDEAMKKALGAAHFYGSWVILGIVAIHAAGAIYHHVVLKDDVLRRMLPGARS